MHVCGNWNDGQEVTKTVCKRRIGSLQHVVHSVPLNGSSQIRHATYTDEGVVVRRHAGVSDPVLIPQPYIDRATAGLEVRTAAGTLTGASSVGQLKPETVALSRAWKTEALATTDQQAAHPEPASVPFTVVRLRSLGYKLYKCVACDKVTCSMDAIERHACAAASADGTVLSRARELAFARTPHAAPPALVAMAPAADETVVAPFERGWARPIPRDHEILDERTTVLLKQWFAEGEASAKTKCSAPTALQRLAKLTDEDGGLLYDEEELPSESRIRRFFGGLTSQRKKVSQAGYVTAAVAPGSLDGIAAPAVASK